MTSIRTLSFRFVLSFFFLFFGSLMALLFLPSPQPSSAASECYELSGVSGYANYPNSGVIDFEYADYGVSDIRETDGTLIDSSSTVCIDEDGFLQGESWHNNGGGWMYWDWCYGGICSGLGQPELDWDTGYASGYVWSGLSWIQLDWTCGAAGSCDEADRFHVDLDTGELAGYGWSPAIGWIAFGGGSGLSELLPDEITVIPILTVTPDPLEATKYGTYTSLGDPITKRAPLADGEEVYTVWVQLYDLDSGTYLEGPDYSVALILNSSSTLWTNQVEQKGEQAVVLLNAKTAWAVATPFSSEGAWYNQYISFAPTSNMNGYDEDGDGELDYWFDVIPSSMGGDGFERSDSVNRYVIDDFTIYVTPSDPSLPEVTWDSSDGLYNLNDDDPTLDYEFKFAPAIEVANLERDQMSGSYIPYIQAISGLEQFFRGLIVNWGSVAFSDTNFKVKSILSIDTPVAPSLPDYVDSEHFEFLFDNEPLSQDGYYTHSSDSPTGVPPTDDTVVVSKFPSISSAPGDPAVLSAFALGSSRYVPLVEPVLYTSQFWPLSGGDLKQIPEETMIVRGPNTIPQDPEAPRYETQVGYEVTSAYLTLMPSLIHYYSNYLPQASGNTDYIAPVEVEGSITSSTDQPIDIELFSGDQVVVLSDELSTIAIRNELFKRFSELVKGITPSSGGGITSIQGAFEPSSHGVPLMDGKLIFFKDVDVYFENLDSTYDQKTIVVWGGNMFINDDFSGDSTIGLMAFKSSSGDGGDIFIENVVTDLVNVSVFAEGSLYSYEAGIPIDSTYGYADWPSSNYRSEALKHQLYFEGNVISQNTLYGYSAAPKVLADGSTASTSAEKDTAREQDLQEMREFTVCWIAVDILSQPIDQDADGLLYDGTDALGIPIPDSDDVEDCPGALRSSTISANYSGSDANVPVMFIYSPIPGDLPILGDARSTSVNVFD